MSTLNVANVTDGTTSVPTGYVVNGSAKSWVGFNGIGTISINDSYNISSITDNATGDYTITLDTDMNNASYGITTGNSNTTTNNGNAAYSSVVAGSFKLRTYRGQDGTQADGANNTAMTLGDLA